MGLGDLFEYGEHEKLTAVQIDEAIEKGEHLDIIYVNQRLTPQQIDAAIEKGKQLAPLFEYNVLSPGQIQAAMKHVNCLDDLYSSQKLTSKLIDTALDLDDTLETKGSRWVLYEHQRLSSQQIDRALETAYTFEDYYNLYRNHDLSPSQIDTAIEKGTLINLSFLYTSPQTSPTQKTEILKKLGVDVPKDLQKSKVWSRVSPTIVVDAIRQFNDSVKSKMKESPIAKLAGTYEVADIHNAWKYIADFLTTKSMSTKQGDYKYAYYTGNDGREKQIKIGRVIKTEPELTKQYSKIQQFGAPDAVTLEVKISIDPEHIAMKSTGQTWTSCETIGAMCGVGEECGWCDDIIANNLIGFIKHKDKDEWLGRCIIRWCIREEDSKPDAVIEKYYGKPRYKDMLVSNLITILRKTGFTGIMGDNTCISPYTYSGYIDSGRQVGRKILYKIGDRPINK